MAKVIDCLTTCKQAFTKYTWKTCVIHRYSKLGVGNLRPSGHMQPTWTFDMSRIRIFVTRVRVQHRVTPKLHDKHVFRYTMTQKRSSRKLQ